MGSSIPSAFQVKTVHILSINPDIKLTSLFMSKYHMYLNCLGISSGDKPPIFVDAVDYGKHVSPSQVKLVNGKYHSKERKTEGTNGQRTRRSYRSSYMRNCTMCTHIFWAALACECVKINKIILGNNT